MQFHPISIGPVVYSGKGRDVGDETKKKREGSPLINLELEVGGFGEQNCVIKQEQENILFTAAQFDELYLQVVIFKYLSSGLPVPFHLVLAIWKSVASSLDCVVGFSPQEFVRRSMMDPEPGRCRRTDGKKWRCHGSVVPDQKYCARHMHRGSQRSRKLVEASKVMNGRISVPISASLDLTIPSATVEVGSTSISYNSNREGSSTNVIHVDRVAAKSSLLRAQAGKISMRNGSNCNDSLALGFNHFSTSKTYWCHQGNKNSRKPSIAAGFGVSPKSVLQGIIGTGCGNLNLDKKTGMETEALRCRRTDGKRWRCRRDVVPDKKYCENHLHRGAKKAMVDSKLITGALGASSGRIAGIYAMKEKLKNCWNLNTNLSISIAASPQQMSESNSSSSDATTVSDENATVSHILIPSP